MDELIDPNVTGTYRCSTVKLRELFTGDQDFEWGAVLTPDEIICLQWVFTEIQANLDESDDPELFWVSSDMIFAKMIDTNGTFVVTVDAEAKTALIDFQPEGEENV